MRSLRPSIFVPATAALLAFAAMSFAPRPVSAEGEPAAQFESAGGIYIAAELGLGGRPLYQRLFPSGWPTTREFRKMTLEDGEAAFADSIGAILASGCGVPLEVSTLERFVLQQRQADEKGKAPGTVSAHLNERWALFAAAAGLKDKPADFSPIFIPFVRGDPIPDKPFDEGKPSTWNWNTKAVQPQITMDSIGLAMYAFTLYAEQQLSTEHKVEVGGTTTSFAGRTDMDGFLAFVALECATAQLRELRDKLCLDAKGGPGGQAIVTAIPNNYDQKKDRGEAALFFFPHGLTATVNKATVSYALGTAPVDSKMRLYDQAALLLGLCELVKAANSGNTGPGRFFDKNKKGIVFDPGTANDALDVAIYIAKTIRHVSWTSRHGGCPTSFSTFDAGPGNTLRIEDAGLLLVALEQFLSIKLPVTAAPAQKAELEAWQKQMSIVIDRVTNTLLDAQKLSKPAGTGFCDVYDIQGEPSPADVTKGEERRSLFAQGLAVRGLLAANRTMNLATYSGRKHQGAVQAAAAVLRWLEDKRWDKTRRVFLDEPGKAGRSKALDAAAVLGGLRDMALETSDARYLLRYKSYLGTLRARGMFLAETSRARSALGPVAEPAPPGTLKTPAEAGRAPVAAAEVTIP